MDIQTTKTHGKYFSVVRSGAPVVHITRKYITRRMAEASAKCWLAFHGEDIVSTEPRTIRFATIKCSRCDGEKRNPAWGSVAGGRCFKCGGGGSLYTQAGKAALEAFEAMRDERLGAAYSEIAEGEAYKLDGKWWERTANSKRRVDPTTRVLRHNGAVTRQMWKEIAAQYPTGAKLIY